MITHNFDFTAFYKRRKESRLAPNKNAQWLTWLIGFAEGDGSFIVTNRGDLMFVITQNNYNIEILHEIQQGLGVGRVIIQSKALNASRYIVQDQIGLSLIVLFARKAPLGLCGYLSKQLSILSKTINPR